MTKQISMCHTDFLGDKISLVGNHSASMISVFESSITKNLQW